MQMCAGLEPTKKNIKKSLAVRPELTNFMPKREMALQEMRCTACGKLLAKIELIEGTVERKCTCGTMNTVTTRKPSASSDQNSTGSIPYQERIPGKHGK